MKLTSINKLMLSGAVALCMVAASSQAFAQGTETVIVSMDTENEFTVTDGDDMDMGSWFAVHRNGDDITISIAEDGSLTNSALTDSIVVDTTGGNGTPATVLVEFPALVDGFVITMTVDNLNDFADAGLSLAQVYWSGLDDNGDPASEVAIAFAGSADVQIALGGAPQTFTFSADVLMTDTPAAGPHTADFTVDFAY